FLNWQGSGEAMHCVRCSASGEIIAMCFMDARPLLIDVANRTSLPLIGHDHIVNAIGLTGDGRLVATAAKDRTIFLWDSMTARKLNEIRLDSSPTAIEVDRSRLTIGDERGRIHFARLCGFDRTVSSRR